MQDNVPVFTLWQEFVAWILQHTDKFPKSKRFSFSLRIENTVLDILEDIVRASYSKPYQKIQYLDKINLNLTVLRILLRLAMREKYLPYNSYEFASEKIEEAGKMIGGWKKTLDEKSKPSL